VTELSDKAEMEVRLRDEFRQDMRDLRMDMKTDLKELVSSVKSLSESVSVMTVEQKANREFQAHRIQTIEERTEDAEVRLTEIESSKRKAITDIHERIDEVEDKIQYTEKLVTTFDNKLQPLIEDKKNKVDWEKVKRSTIFGGMISIIVAGIGIILKETWPWFD